ncbi:hypothetical protein GJS26_00868 [Pectobacterium carotovorum subsp. carotovorum]|nr:hypothetical protein [Pectobacterium carotovorum subsp. carotovorum]
MVFYMANGLLLFGHLAGLFLSFSKHNYNVTIKLT